MQFARETHRLLAVRGFTRDLDSGQFAEQSTQPFASRRLVVDDQHPLAHSEELRVASST